MFRGSVSSFAEVQKAIDEAVKRIPLAVATEARQIIIDNSAKGDDIKGQKMIKYSEPYKKWRAKHGLTTDPVNLRKEGKLLDDTTIVSAGNKSRLKPADNRRVIAEGIMKLRKFYPETDTDITPDFIKRIEQAGEKAIENK